MRPVIAVLLSAALAIPVAGCGEQDSTEPVPVSSSIATTSLPTTTTALASTGRPVVIDTDVAIEGMMSVLYLANQDELDIRAITVSGTGLVHCEQGVAQVLGLLELIDAPEIPVACGLEAPIEGINAFPSSWRATADSGYGLELASRRTASEMDAPTLIAATIAESEQPVAVYADGPQTNLAAALRLDPSIVGNVEMAYIMGGALDVAGNTIRNPDAEWNIWVDPVAAEEVFGSGMPITLVPLDATNQVPLNVLHLEALQAHENGPAAGAVVTMLESSDQIDTGGLFFWDQLTAALLVDETYGSATNRSVEVLLDEDRSVAGTMRETASGPSMRVVETVDRQRFETDFLSSLAGEDVGPIVLDADWTVRFDGEQWSTDVPESLEPGEYVVHLANSGDGDAGLVFGWLLGDATAEDMDAWEGIDQPPFYDFDFFVYMAPRSDIVSKVTISIPHEYLLVGLDVAGDVATRIAFVDVPD